MALLVCAGCSTAYAVGLPVCPHCGRRDSDEEATPMPKITVLGGATNRADDVPAVDTPTGPEPEVEPAVDGDDGPGLDAAAPAASKPGRRVRKPRPATP